MAEEGITGLAARLPDGTKVASLPYVGGEDRAQVVDEAALVAWMETNRPGEIVKNVRKETLKAVLDAANADRPGRRSSDRRGDPRHRVRPVHALYAGEFRAREGAG